MCLWGKTQDPRGSGGKKGPRYEGCRVVGESHRRTRTWGRWDTRDEGSSVRVGYVQIPPWRRGPPRSLDLGTYLSLTSSGQTELLS